MCMATRAPISRERWVAPLAMHFATLALFTFFANALVVTAYMTTGGNPPPIGVIAQQGMMWGALRLHVGVLIYVGTVAATQAALDYRRTRARELNVAKLEGQLARARASNAQRADSPALSVQYAAHDRATLALRPQRRRRRRARPPRQPVSQSAKLDVAVSRSRCPKSSRWCANTSRSRRRAFATGCRPTVHATDRGDVVLRSAAHSSAARRERDPSRDLCACRPRGKVDVRAEVDAKRLHLSVRDDGPGVRATAEAARKRHWSSEHSRTARRNSTATLHRSTSSRRKAAGRS